MLDGECLMAAIESSRGWPEELPEKQQGNRTLLDFLREGDREGPLRDAVRELEADKTKEYSE